MINVTKAYLPKKEKYYKYVDEIFDSGWITNHGQMVQKLEKKLAEYLGVKNIILVSSGTVALETAYRALEIKGEVITTPFSFVATTSSMVTNGLKPIFADINTKTLNIEVNNIEKLINAATGAIVPVHVFGNGCDVDEIESVAKKNGLKVIYDAAHAFDIKHKGQSILNYGDISTLSFHATKLFHTIEGGALIVNDDSLVEKVRLLINFGIENAESIIALGTNAKMNEFEAAMGLCILDDIEEIKSKRKKVYDTYKRELHDLVEFQQWNPDSSLNYGYFPIIFKNTEQTLNVQKALNEDNVFPRRYFYPSLDSLSYIVPSQFMKNSRDIGSRILCLPLYPDLPVEKQRLIVDIIKNSITRVC